MKIINYTGNDPGKGAGKQYDVAKRSGRNGS